MVPTIFSSMAILQADFWLLLLVGAYLARQAIVSLAAERGRKKDLIKKLYKANTDFRISVLVPFLNTKEVGSLMALTKAIQDQDYPKNRVTLHIACTPETEKALEAIKSMPNVQVWVYNKTHVIAGTIITWLIERLLAKGGSAAWFVFLNPTDIIKPDYFQNIVARGFDSFVLQGYVAMKQRPASGLGKVVALASRLGNRIENAGRFHLGLGCNLMDSGWAVKQDLLEMVPYHRGDSVDNMEYMVSLLQHGFKVTWAPTVVTYSDEATDLLPYLKRQLNSAFDRLRMALVYGPALFVRGLTSFSPAKVESALSILRPPALLLALVLLAGAYIEAYTPYNVPGTANVWLALGSLSLLMHVFALMIARCPWQDTLNSLVWTPVIYGAGTVLLPVVMVKTLFEGLSSGKPSLPANQPARAPHARASRQTRNDFFDEPEMPEDHFPRLPESAVMSHSNSHGFDEFEAVDSVGEDLEALSRKLDASNRTPKEQVRSVPLSNGKKHVLCLLKILTDYTPEGQELYRMVLEYKTVSFSTSAYRILDQAFYELHTKLAAKGLTLMTCGTCGSFYNPTADVPDAIRNAGVCLYDKQGQDVNPLTDSVTVVSQACPYHCGIEQREAIVRRWLDSLNGASPELANR